MCRVVLEDRYWKIQLAGDEFEPPIMIVSSCSCTVAMITATTHFERYSAFNQLRLVVARKNPNSTEFRSPSKSL